MDFELSDDQQMLMTAFEGLLERHRDLPIGPHGYVHYSADLQAELADAGFAEIATQEGFGLLDAALLAEAAAHCPASVEFAASAMVGPLLDGAVSPVAVAWGIGKPVRYIEQARTVVVVDGDRVWIGTPTAVRPLDSTSAYPLGVLEALPADAREVSGEAAAAIRRRAILSLSAEAAGLMRGAVDHTVQYVKEREQFGHPLGDFQGIQHRLAESAQLARATRWLAFRAAFEDTEASAATALLYAQDAARKVVTDCHQFCGAMGLTLEFPLHLWTYRLKILQGEAGGKGAQARGLANELWGALAA